MRKKTLYLTFILFMTLITSCQNNTPNQKQSVMTNYDQKVDSLLSLMTLKEKIGQMNQYNGFWDVTGPAPKEGNAEMKYSQLKTGMIGSMLNVAGVKNVRAVQKIAVEQTRLGIPLIIGLDVIHGYKTLSPIPLAEAASWDMEAIKKSARIAATEASAAGVNWTFAPMVDVTRDPRWGRIMESGGEDPYLGSLIAAARVKGFQGDDLSAVNTLAACVKHFAGYGFVEAGREYNRVDMSLSRLHNTVLPPFKAAKEAGARTFMNAFNDLNGIPATGNEYLLRDILKGEWAFKGLVVSDWASIDQMIAHGYAKNLKSATSIALKAGVDMDMESSAYVNELENLVKEKKVSIDLIDDAVKRILKLKFELGLFDNPYKYCDEDREKQIVNSPELHRGVLEMAKKSIVLLKNDRHLLPLKKKGQTIAVIGALANDKNSPLGSWRLSADNNTAVSVLEGLKKYIGNTLKYAKGVDVTVGKTEFIREVTINKTDRSGFKKAINTAKNADVVLIVLGENGFETGEGRSKSSINLSKLQQELLQKVYAVNKNTVLILMNGRPLAINWAAENIPTIVEAWQLGTQTGNAIAQVVYGDYNPSGKLPVTFPKNVGQIPIYYNHLSTGRPLDPGDNQVWYSHYSDVSNKPLYPFGYGLSYTTFNYANLKQSSADFDKNGAVTFTVEVTNTGKLAGEEVVQWYIHDLVGSLVRPVRELKGFNKISLKPNETKTVSFKVDKKTITYFTAHNKWEAETGDFKLFVGGDSNAKLETNFSYK
ncbi:MAG: beta-glucosidase BglX [Flavobacteriaceae bacterium]